MTLAAAARYVMTSWALSLCVVGPAGSAEYSVVYSFPGGSGGQNPYTTPGADSAGQLYIEASGGLASDGAVFRLAPPSDGGISWTATDIYDFSTAKKDNFCALGPLLVDASGNIYGGGHEDCNLFNILGVTYRLTPSAGVYQLADLSISSTLFPITGLHFGADGLLYGGAGQASAPTQKLFNIPPQGGVLQARPVSGGQLSELSTAFNGHLFYTTTTGGAEGLGTIGMLTTASGKAPRASLIYSFQGGGDAKTPSIYAPVKGTDAAVYGCALGGAFGLGSIFRLAPPAAGQTNWTETIIYSFSLADTLTQSVCALTAGPGRALVGLLPEGGGSGYPGVVFKLSPPTIAGTAWTYSVLHVFTPIAGALSGPVQSLVRVGNSYFGTAYNGGSANYGGIYELIP